ncbi:MAG TPA: Rpp14/Pop5 family protein [Candidatus Thermoplasmatota archaeon]|nr:Rpp14/Pop5 family protein [Candidatus Thermoplasmatota archaeon]
MTVKDRVGRTRYVAFRVAPGPVSRHALGQALPPAAKLTRFDGTHGIVRTSHRERDAVVEALRAVASVGGAPARVETLRTSGTIRGAARALPQDSPAAKRSPKAK